MPHDAHLPRRKIQLNTGIFIQGLTGAEQESGALDEMLSKSADYYEDEVDNAVDNLTAMIEPAMMVFLGVVVGGLIVAMYLPIFQMGEAVR